MLSFAYRIYTSDRVDQSDVHVWLSRTDGTPLATVLRDGFRSCDDPPLPPPPGYSPGWRTATHDLSAYRGQNVRIVFETRNLRPGSASDIWALVDDVRVLDAGPLPELPGPYREYVPGLWNARHCDPVGMEQEAAP